MDPTEDILRTWRALVNPTSSVEDCQAALLQVTGTQSFTFDPDPTATPADVQAVESGGSLLLDSASPAAKAMGKTVHVGVGVVSQDDCCLGIFNAKDARARMDPVVRVCSLPKAGREGCTSTSHVQHKIAFAGKRILIRTPTVSKATVPAYFSLPYLKVESLPPAQKMMDKIAQLQAPVCVWRSFFDGSAAAIAKIFPGFSAIASPQTVSTLKVETSLSPEEGKAPKSDEDSPSSYDFLSEIKEEGEGLEEHKEDLLQSETVTTSPNTTSVKVVQSLDFLESNQKAMDVAQAVLGLGVGLSEEELQYNIQGQTGASARNAFDNDSYESEDDSLDSRNRRSSKLIGDPSPARLSSRDAPTRSIDKVPMSSNLSVDSKLAGDPVSVMLLQQILASQQAMDTRVRALELENQGLRSKLRQVRATSEKAMNVGSSFAASHADSISSVSAQLAKLRRDFVAKSEDLDLNGIEQLRKEFRAFGGWRNAVSERIGSLEVDMRNEDGLLLSQIRECRSAVAAGDLGDFTVAGQTFQNEESVLSFIQTLSSKNNYVTFPSMKDFFSLCGDPVSSLSENMVLHKATKGADFEDTFTARVNTAHVVTLPGVFARKSTSGDTFKTVWTPAFKSYSSFSGGMKNGGRTSVERQLRKVQEMYRG